MNTCAAPAFRRAEVYFSQFRHQLIERPLKRVPEERWVELKSGVQSICLGSNFRAAAEIGWIERAKHRRCFALKWQCVLREYHDMPHVLCRKWAQVIAPALAKGAAAVQEERDIAPKSCSNCHKIVMREAKSPKLVEATESRRRIATGAPKSGGNRDRFAQLDLDGEGATSRCANNVDRLDDKVILRCECWIRTGEAGPRMVQERGLERAFPRCRRCR